MDVKAGGSDSRFLRDVGVGALGFTCMPRTKIRLHDHNEYLSEHVFLAGIDVYVDIIRELANV